MIIGRGLPGLFAAWSLAIARFADERNEMLCAVLAADDPQHTQHPGNPKRDGGPVQPAERNHGIGARDHHTDDDQASARVFRGFSLSSRRRDQAWESSRNA